ncbi:hypothetical protein QQ045_030944 [Rhodiola kirilowii]
MVFMDANINPKVEFPSLIVNEKLATCSLSKKNCELLPTVTRKFKFYQLASTGIRVCFCMSGVFRLHMHCKKNAYWMTPLEKLFCAKRLQRRCKHWPDSMDITMSVLVVNKRKKYLSF